jgi:hypothetical protein
VLRRRIKADLATVEEGDPDELRLSFAELTDDTIVYEYAVLVTSLTGEILTIAQLYRDRADAENPFDELKNHLGLGRFYHAGPQVLPLYGPHHGTDLQLLESVRSPGRSPSADLGHHQSPVPAACPARLTRDSGQTRITISHPHAEAAWVESACREIAAFFKTLRQTAEQLTPLQRWYRVLSRALVKYLNGRELHPPPGLPAPA